MSTLAKSLWLCGLCLALSAGAACRKARERTEQFPANNPADNRDGKIIAAPTGTNNAGQMLTIRALEARVKQYPDDFVANNKLANYYLQFQRETGNTQYIELARKAAENSLKILPAEQNKGGLFARAQAAFAAHDFAATRDDAQQMITLDSQKSYGYQIAGDAYAELGDYDAAMTAYKQMAEKSGGVPSAGIAARQARMAFLKGDNARSEMLYTMAYNLSKNSPAPLAEQTAWAASQLGELAFWRGDYKRSEEHYREALATFPDYYRALAGVGRARAAQGDTNAAIEFYEQATNKVPEFTSVAALADLYKIAEREKDAAAKYALVEQIARLSTLNGTLYNRSLAVFYADHKMKPEEALTAAQGEYEKRRDIYGADAVGWTALQAGKLDLAQSAIKDALKLKTQDPRILYHAGMIAQAVGDKTTARGYLERALKLSPQFDPVQAENARQALTSLS